MRKAILDFRATLSSLSLFPLVRFLSSSSREPTGEQLACSKEEAAASSD